MKLIELLVEEFANPDIQVKAEDWPEGVVAEHCYSSIEFDGWKYNYTSRYGGQSWITSFEIDVDGRMKSVDEWQDGEKVTREEYFAFVEANPNFLTDLAERRRKNVGRIAELNKIAYDAVDEAIKLSHEAGLPYTCTMPSSVADLDENSDWDASRC